MAFLILRPLLQSSYTPEPCQHVAWSRKGAGARLSLAHTYSTVQYSTGGEAELCPHLVGGLQTAQLGGQQRVGHDVLVYVPVLDAGDVDQLPATQSAMDRLQL